MNPREQNFANDIRHIRFQGTSMWPTLSAPDLLEIVPCGPGSAKPGDVILFIPPNEKTHVVHRIVRIGEKGIITKGDCSEREDPWLLPPECVLGRVTHACRGTRRRKIAGGVLGIATGRAALFCRTIRPFLGPMYWYLAEKGIFRRILTLRPRIVSVKSQTCGLFYLTFGKRVIGRLDPATGAWVLNKPFHLFVDRNALPQHNDFEKNQHC